MLNTLIGAFRPLLFTFYRTSLRINGEIISSFMIISLCVDRQMRGEVAPSVRMGVTPRPRSGLSLSEGMRRKIYCSSNSKFDSTGQNFNSRPSYSYQRNPKRNVTKSRAGRCLIKLSLRRNSRCKLIKGCDTHAHTQAGASVSPSVGHLVNHRR